MIKLFLFQSFFSKKIVYYFTMLSVYINFHLFLATNDFFMFPIDFATYSLLSTNIS